jgi:hypothetical protein
MKKFVPGTSNIFGRLLALLPGKRFGVYRTLPIFFLFGAALEYSMIHWRAGTTNFCENIFFYFNFFSAEG